MARSSLREFQERLARRLAEASGAERRGLLGFQCGGDNWVIELAEAGEILPPPPLSTVPLTRPWFRGLANVRGTLYGVVDFAAFLLPSGNWSNLIWSALTHSNLGIIRSLAWRFRLSFWKPVVTFIPCSSKTIPRQRAP